MHKLAALCVRRPVFATMLILALVVVGGFSYFSLGVDLTPKVDVPTVSVTVVNPGATAEEIETDITKRIEDAVNTISDIDDVRSTSVQGLSTVVVSFSLDKNGDVGAQEIRDKVATTLPDLPETAEAPVIQKFDPDATPIMQLVVSGTRPLREVTEIADKQIKQRLENVKGVGEIRLVGGLKREIRVWVDPERMRAYGLSITDVANALRQQNVELPAGSVTQGASELTVRTLGRLADPAQFNEIAVATRGPYPVKLRDIGHAEDSQEEATTASRLNGEPSVTLMVSKQSGTNAVATAQLVKDRLKEMQLTLPKDIHIEIVNDQSMFIKAAIDAIQSHLIEGSLLAAAVIFLFLANIRTTLIAAVAIPVSIISTFALMAAMNFTLNQISMLALTLMVGIVIDDAIIVLENIYRFIEEKGMKPDAGGGGRHQRDRHGGDGHHAVAAGGLPAHRLHGRHRGTFHVVLRIDGVLRDRGLPAGFVHADADAELPLPEGSQGSPAITSRLPRIRRSSASWTGITPRPGLGDGAPQDHGGHQRAGDLQHYPAVQAGREEFHAGGRPLRISGLRPDAGRNFAGGHHECDGTDRPRHPRDAERDGDADYGRGRHGSRRQFRLHLRQADSQGPAPRIAAGNDDQDARRLQELSVRFAHQRGRAELERQRRRPVRHQRSGSRQALAILAANARPAQDRAQGGRRGHVAGLRQTRAAGRNRPPARGRSGRPRVRHRHRAEHHGRRPGGFELSLGRRTVRCAAARRAASFAPAPTR